MNKKSAIDKARTLCQQLCDSNKEASQKFDLKNKLTSVDKPYTEIGTKLGKFILISYGVFIYVFFSTTLQYITYALLICRPTGFRELYILGLKIAIFLLDERLKALDGAVHAGQQFKTSLQDMLQWVENKNEDLDTIDPISAEGDQLHQQQLQNDVSVREM